MDTGRLIEPITGRKWGKAEVLRQVAIRVRSYQADGFEHGDRVLILFGNRLEFFAELLAIWHLGGCVIPVDSRLTPFEVKILATAAAARFYVFDDETNPATVSVISGGVSKNTLKHDDDAAEVSLSGEFPRLDDDALILFTSGSTGKPKGVVHTHRTLKARWIALNRCLGIESYCRTLCLLPTHFGHGLICNCLFPWLAGCDLYIVPPFRSDLIVQLGALIDEHEISFMSSVPSVWNLALKAASPPKLKSLKRIHVGSAPLSKSIWEEIQQWAAIRDVFNVYGITETGSWVAGTTGGSVTPESGLIGSPWGSTIKVLKTDSVDNAISADLECDNGETGMIWLNTPALMKGYFQRQDLTDAVISQGWFMTGDIGLINDQGQLFLKGRERDEINKGGMKIYPADVDEVFEQSGTTQDICTFRLKDELYGENVGIALVLKDRGEDTIRNLHHWIDTHLAQHKQPVRWYVLDDIPRTSSGKINRETVRHACTSRTHLNLQQILQNANSG